jgi:protein SCO1/2
MRRLRIGAWLLIACLTTGAAHGSADLLRDEKDRPVSAAQLTGRWLLVTFGYSRCPDICPTTLHTVSAALKDLNTGAARLEAYFVTVDPTHDTPSVLRRFLGGFSPHLHGLTGSAAALEDARRTFGVPVKTSGAGFDHGVFVYLVNPKGEVVDTFHPDIAPKALTRRLRARLTAP